MIVPRMLGKTAYEWPFEICEMHDPRPHMVLCTAGMFMEDAEADRIGLTAYLRASASAPAPEAKMVEAHEVENKAVEMSGTETPVTEPSDVASDETPRVLYPPESRRIGGRGGSR